MSEPRTEAGRRLLEVWMDGRTHPPSTRRRRDFEELVLAIEAEASSSDELRAAAQRVASFPWRTSNPEGMEAIAALRAVLHASRLDADKEGEAR